MKKRTEQLKKPVVRIFVSHRIDQDSVIVKNDVFVPVRCGAVFDQRDNHPDIIGDDTGDNISEKRMSYNELTVQYWAWKNVDADYYGLCHYRRYLDFGNNNEQSNCVHELYAENELNSKTIIKHGLDNPQLIVETVAQSDLIVPFSYDVSKVNIVPKANTVEDLWLNQPRVLLKRTQLDYALSIIKEDYPQYYSTAISCLRSSQFRGYNCFVMTKDLFFQMCDFQFGVLGKIEDHFKDEIRVGYQERYLGYLSEILNFIFTTWVQNQKKYTVNERRLIFFANTDRVKDEQNTSWVKRFIHWFFPAYRVASRIEKQSYSNMFQLNNDIQSLTTQVNLLSANISRTSTTLTEQIRALDKFQKFSFFVSQPKYPADFNQIKQDFWDTYPKAVGALRTHQKKCTQLLASLKEISDKIGVKFWLHGGTLVGAIRHHGFVPWDDDIDVAMMRHDYEKLEKELGKSDDYQILKFYDVGLGCRCYRFSLPKDDFQQYFIDIFVYDNCQIEVDNAGDEWERRKSLHLQLQKQMALLSTNYYTHADIVSKEDAEKFDALFTSFIDKTLENTSHGTDYVCWGIENNFENPSRPAWKIGRIYERADLFPLQKVTFENLTLLTPHRADRFIYAEYGGDVFDIPSDMGCSKHDSVK